MKDFLVWLDTWLPDWLRVWINPRGKTLIAEVHCVMYEEFNGRYRFIDGLTRSSTVKAKSLAMNSRTHYRFSDPIVKMYERLGLSPIPERMLATYEGLPVLIDDTLADDVIQILA